MEECIAQKDDVADAGVENNRVSLFGNCEQAIKSPIYNIINEMNGFAVIVLCFTYNFLNYDQNVKLIIIIMCFLCCLIH